MTEINSKIYHRQTEDAVRRRMRCAGTDGETEQV